MLTVHPQYLVDEKDARKTVIIPINEWDRILEELDDIGLMIPLNRKKARQFL